MVNFMPDVFEALFRNFRHMFIIFTHVGIKSFEVGHHICSIQFPGSVFVNFLENLLNGSVMLSFLLVFSINSGLLRFIYEIVELNHVFISSYYLCWGGLKQVFDSICDSGLDFEVWLNCGIGEVKLPQSEFFCSF
jgi:hypothetical protein